MKIAELFIQLAIKGAGKAKEGLTGVHKALQGARDTSWELKAGIFGAVVALEEITRRAVLSAVDLKNFAGATGLSTLELQKWGYWAEINDVKAENMASTIKGLQAAQSALRLGQGVPAGAVYFGLNQANNPIEMMGEIQKKLRQIGTDQKEIGNARTMAATLGISDDMFAALRIGTVGFAGLRKEMMLTGKEQQELLKLNRQWNDFWLTLKGSSNKTVANDLAGPVTDFVHTLRNAVVEVAELSDKFNKAVGRMGKSDQVKLKAAFEGLALAVVAAFAPLGPLIAGIVLLAGALDQIYKYTHGEKSLIGDPATDQTKMQSYRDVSKIGGASSDIAKNKGQFGVAAGPLGMMAKFGEWLGSGGMGAKLANDFLAPRGAGDMNVDVKMTNHITEAGNAKDSGDAIQKALTNAVFQNPAVTSYLKGQPQK